MQHKQTPIHSEFEHEPIDDVNVLNYLLQHVRGLSPSSLVPEYIADNTKPE